MGSWHVRRNDPFPDGKRVCEYFGCDSMTSTPNSFATHKIRCLKAPGVAEKIKQLHAEQAAKEAAARARRRALQQAWAAADAEKESHDAPPEAQHTGAARPAMSLDSCSL